MKHGTKDTAGLYRLDRDPTGRQLRFDRGTLLLEGVAELPAGLDTWFCYDHRVDAYRAPANCYNDIIGPLKGELTRNKAPRYPVSYTHLDVYKRQRLDKGRRYQPDCRQPGPALLGVLEGEWA